MQAKAHTAALSPPRVTLLANSHGQRKPGRFLKVSGSDEEFKALIITKPIGRETGIPRLQTPGHCLPRLSWCRDCQELAFACPLGRGYSCMCSCGGGGGALGTTQGHDKRTQVHSGPFICLGKGQQSCLACTNLLPLHPKKDLPLGLIHTRSPLRDKTPVCQPGFLSPLLSSMSGRWWVQV